MQLYWDTLEWIVNAAKMLQRHNIPENDVECHILRLRLEQAKLTILEMLYRVQPYHELWCGDPNDPMRGTRIPVKDWDDLMKNI